MAHSTPPEKPLEVGGLRSPSWSLVVPALSTYIRTLTQTCPHVHMDTHTLPNVHTLTYASHTYAFSPGRLRKTRSRGISSSSQHRAVDLPGLCASCSPASRAEKTQVTQDTAAFSAAAWITFISDKSPPTCRLHWNYFKTNNLWKTNLGFFSPKFLPLPWK